MLKKNKPKAEGRELGIFCCFLFLFQMGSGSRKASLREGHLYKDMVEVQK